MRGQKVSIRATRSERIKEEWSLIPVLPGQDERKKNTKNFWNGGAWSANLRRHPVNNWMGPFGCRVSRAPSKAQTIQGIIFISRPLIRDSVFSCSHIACAFACASCCVLIWTHLNSKKTTPPPSTFHLASRDCPFRRLRTLESTDYWMSVRCVRSARRATFCGDLEIKDLKCSWFGKTGRISVCSIF